MLTAIMRHSDPFVRLKRSSYRRNMRLTALEREFVVKEGFDKVVEKCKGVLEDLDMPDYTHGETSYNGVVPKAQHATSTCCRKCLFNWHGIPRYRPLTDDERAYIIRLILRWVRKELDSVKLPS
jgi:hypothetical protein